MKLKRYLGKDTTITGARKTARRNNHTPHQPQCRNCGDDLDTAGFCRKCSACLAHYRMVDAARQGTGGDWRGGGQ